MDMTLMGITPTPLAFHLPIADVEQAQEQRIGFALRIVKGVAASDDGRCVIEFDARNWLETASDQDLILLLDEWCVGDGPACRRVLERHSKDTQAFLAYTEQHQQDWVLDIDSRATREWIESKKPYLVSCIDEEMITG